MASSRPSCCLRESKAAMDPSMFPCVPEGPWFWYTSWSRMIFCKVIA
jgi:hypothetical protein